MNGNTEYHVDQRLSLKGQLLTVRYFGSVEDKAGAWLGVEWDDFSRGKHDGVHNGIRYFECKSKSPTAASFLKPSQPWDKPRSFLPALKEKYMPEDAGAVTETVYFSSKQAEEIGFDKFARRQAQLHGIHVLVLDQMQISLDELSRQSTPADQTAIEETCINITDIDLSRNLIETTHEIHQLCKHLRSLRRLTLDGNRFSVHPVLSEFGCIQYLSLSETLIDQGSIVTLSAMFPKLDHLVAASNELRTLSLVDTRGKLRNLRTLDLSGNFFSRVPSVQSLSALEQLKVLVLKHNQITDFADEITSGQGEHSTLENLDLAHNEIASLSVLNALPLFYPKVKHLRLTGNPVYTDLKSADGRLLTADDGYMLTIARLSQLETLNYSTITDKERLNAETYYLGQIATELSLAAPEREAGILSQHPRWEPLCEEYGQPTIQRSVQEVEIDPDSLAARLVTLTFSLSLGTGHSTSARSWSEQVPKSLNIYAVLGIVGKRLRIMPLKLRLIWETGERDPAGFEGQYSAPEWWNSDDEDDGNYLREDQFVAREVELVAGTRPLGSYVEGREARIRIEVKS